MKIEGPDTDRRPRTRRTLSHVCWLVLAVTVPQPQTARSQWFPERSEDCGAHICLETGRSNWRAEPSNYCEEGICLQDSLQSLVSLGWRRMTRGQDALTADESNPFVGLTDEEYGALRRLDNDDIGELVELLGQVRVACRQGSFSIDLSLPGRNSANVTFATPLADDGGFQGFQVIRVDRRYRITTGRTGSWLRWIHNRFPGIVRMEGAPASLANYEMGLYVGSVVLVDTEFRFGQPEAYGEHPDCLAR